MGRYVLRRFVYLVFTLWVIVTITFLLMHAIPGDPFRREKAIPPAIMANLKAKYGLDDPWHVQYTRWIGNLLQGDLGISMKYTSRTVNEMIHDGFPYSADLGLRALAFAVTVGLCLGVIAALNHNGWRDRSAMVIAVIGVSVPGFVIGTLLQYFISVKLDLLPVAGWDTWQHRILPPFALGLGTLALMARMMRASMLDVVNQDY
ncbi:MAG: ABC transporter permease, partial [Bacillota bacterium]